MVKKRKNGTPRHYIAEDLACGNLPAKLEVHDSTEAATSNSGDVDESSDSETSDPPNASPLIIVILEEKKKCPNDEPDTVTIVEPESEACDTRNPSKVSAE